MTRRHRIPTVFSLYMIDVLCCALGCVILMWLLNLRETKQAAEAASATGKELDETKALLKDKTRQEEEARQSLKDSRDEVSASARLLEQTRAERDRLQRDADAARGRLAELDKLLATLRTQKASTEETLAQKNKSLSDVEKDLLAARQRTESLESLVKDKENLFKSSAKNADDLADKLRQAELLAKQLKTVADLLPGMREKLAVEEARTRDLEKSSSDRKKQLEDAQKILKDLDLANSRLLQEIANRSKDLSSSDKRIETLLVEKKTLQDLINRAKASADSRFAGIALTGKRVVFLVDMSGSMDLADEKTPAPDKWPLVRETLVKIMRSLPELEKFQLVVFSDRVTYPLGGEGNWISYDSNSSGDSVLKSLAAIKPKGGTNIYSALDAAFRLRANGLDTVYLFSDGLPNLGPGLTQEESQRSNEIQRGDILAKYVRRTLQNDWNRAANGKPKVRINTVGFFYESPDLGSFLWSLARENDGSFVGMSKP